MPEQDLSEVCAPEFATQQWHFQELSGQTQMRTAEQLENLTKKLQTMEPLSLWGEPIELTNGGPEFFAKCKETLLKP
jgi:hypothetical protein